MLQSIVLMAHLMVATCIIIFVLLQRGKGADAGTGFGAGASGTVFGSRGTSNFFSRTTAVLAVLFFATSLTLAYFATQRTAPESLLEGSLMGEPGERSPAAVPPTDGDAADLPALDGANPPDSGESQD